jgi:hypothetical protein
LEQPRVPVRSVVATIGLTATLAFAMLACGSSREKSGGNAGGCQAGQAIEQVKGTDLPACAAHEPAASTYRYPCTHPQGAGFFVVYLPSTQLYGKPGGVWHEAAANVAFAKLNQALGC